MAFLESQFPSEISYGSRGGPGFNTRVIELDSGHFRSVKRRSQSRRKYNVKEGLRNLEDLNAVKRFYLAIGGVGVGFRFKDWDDYTTASDDFSAHSFDDVVIGTGDGAVDDFQLKKLYVQGAFTHTRTILKPVSGTTRASLDDTELPATVGGTPYTFAVDTATGIVTITPAPANALVVKAGFEFDTPVMFSPEVDDLLDISIDSFQSGSIPDIPLIEVLNPTPLSDAYFTGGSKSHGALAANTNISESQGRFHVAGPTTLNGANPWQLRLPDPATLSGGGVWFAFGNDGSEEFDVADDSGTPLVTVPPGVLAEVWISIASGIRTWWAK